MMWTMFEISTLEISIQSLDAKRYTIATHLEFTQALSLHLQSKTFRKKLSAEAEI